MDNDTITIQIPANMKYLNVVGAAIMALLEHDGSQDHAYNMQLAIHEVCTNIIEHAYGHDSKKHLSLRLKLSETVFVACLDDRGESFDPKAVKSPNFDEPQVRGMGLFLVNELMDKVDYQCDADGNHWTLTKYLKEQTT